MAKGRDGRRGRRCPDPRRADGPAGRHRVSTVDRRRVRRLYDSLALRVGGDEVRALAGGLDYPGAEALTGVKFEAVETTAAARAGASTGATRASGPADARRVRSKLHGWPLLLDYRVSPEFPRIRLSFALTRPPAEVRPVRNVELELVLALDAAEWLVHAPGNRVAPGTCLADLDADLAISPVTGSLGSLGLVALSHHSAPACLVLWPFSRSEIGWITLSPEKGGVRLRLTTNLAGDPAPGEPLRYTGINLDALDRGWGEVRGRIRPALRSLGVRSPGPKPDCAGRRLYTRYRWAARCFPAAGPTSPIPVSRT